MRERKTDTKASTKLNIIDWLPTKLFNNSVTTVLMIMVMQNLNCFLFIHSDDIYLITTNDNFHSLQKVFATVSYMRAGMLLYCVSYTYRSIYTHANAKLTTLKKGTHNFNLCVRYSWFYCKYPYFHVELKKNPPVVWNHNDCSSAPNFVGIYCVIVQSIITSSKRQCRKTAANWISNIFDQRRSFLFLI